MVTNESRIIELSQKYGKQSRSRIKSKLKEVELDKLVMSTISELKGYDIVFYDRGYQQYKKYPKQFFREVIGLWYEDFVDEDNGDVHTITRYIRLGHIVEDIFYSKSKVYWNNDEKTFVLDGADSTTTICVIMSTYFNSIASKIEKNSKKYVENLPQYLK